MSDRINDGGPAFPGEQGYDPEDGWNKTWGAGMSLRDYFAGQALAGLIADREWYDTETASTIAMRAYELADAMLAAREGVVS